MKKVSTWVKLANLLVINLLVVFDGNSAVITSQQNGNWNSTSTWDLGRVPTNGDTINVNHMVEIPNKATLSLNDVHIFVAVSLSMVNQSTLTLNNASTMTLYLNATFSRTTGNGAASIGGTSLMSNGSGVQQTGLATADLNGWNSGSGLPVTLLDFVAELTEEAVKLKWSTSSEINNDYFVVQRKQESSWESIGEVHGFGTTNKIHYYQYDDFDIDMGVLAFYRLKQVDLDGEIDYSKVVDVSPIKLKGHSYSFVNIGNNVTLKFEDDHKEFTSIYVINAEGEHVRTFDFDSINKGDELSIELEGLVQGWYVVGIVGKDNAHFEKMLFVE